MSVVDDDPLVAEVLEDVRKHTDPTPDGKQSSAGNVWTGRRRLRGDAAKPHTGYTKDSLERALNVLVSHGEVISYHGLVAPADPDHLRAIIDVEVNSNITRSVLVARCNRLLAEKDGDSA